MKKLTPEEKEKLQAMLDQHNTQATSFIPTVSAGRRFANHIIDGVLCQIAVFLLLIFFLITGLIQSPTNNRAALWLFGLSVYFLYYFVSETAFQRTLGKLVTGTKVVMLDGSKPSAGTIAARTSFRFIPFEPLSVLVGTSWWHDSWSKTDVVSAKSAHNT